MHWVNSAQAGVEHGVAILALGVLRAKDVEIGAQWSEAATMENSTRSGKATQAENLKGASRQWCGKVGWVN